MEASGLPARVDGVAVEVHPTIDAALTAVALKAQVKLIQDVMKDTMKDGEHYGAIPGCGPKPTLLKPGAEKLCLTFRLSPSYGIARTNLDDGHREYEVVTTLTHIDTGKVIGQGVGTCSTMEKKYKKSPPADIYNTVLKMGKKRSLVDAALTATAASDIFTQDIEEMGKDNGNGSDELRGVLASVCTNWCKDQQDAPGIESFKKTFEAHIKGHLNDARVKKVEDAIAERARMVQGEGEPS